MGKLEISLSFDDGAKQDMRLVELLTKYGLTATFYIPVMWKSLAKVKGWEPLDSLEVQQIADTFELGAHGVTHDYLTKIPFDTARWEIEDSKKQLQDMFGHKVTKFAYPRGYATDQLIDIVRKNYEHGRSTLVNSLDPQEDPAWQHTTVHVGYDRAEYNGEGWFDFATRKLRSAVLRKEAHYRVWGHSWEIEKYNGWHQLEVLFREIQIASTPS